MNKSIYTTAYYSLVVQFIIAFVSLLGTFIKVDTQDKILNEMLVLETIVQFIEFSFYVWLVFNFSNIKSDISIVRYYDWFISTPAMLFVLISAMIYFQKKNNCISTEDLSLVSIYNQHNSTINKILVANALMLILGYLGEVNIISKIGAFFWGTALLCYAFYYIYVNFVQDQTINNVLFWINFILWSGYGVAYLLSHENKNNMYTVLDVFAKNINSLFLLLFIVFKYYF